MGKNMRAVHRRGLLVPLAFAGAMMVTACEDETAPPFEVEGTGSMEGLVFFDADEDGVFTPTAGDSALANVEFLVRERSTDLVLSSSSTGANGRFLVEGLPLGTHDLFIDTLTVPGTIRFCQNPQPVTVYRSETTYEPVDGKSSCLVTIAEAEALASGAEFVTVAGVVTSSPGQITGPNMFIQDETGGLLIFGGSLTGLGIEVGDYVEVSGTIVQYYNTLELTNPEIKAHIPDYGEADPELVTTAQVSAEGGLPTSFIQGLLVTVEAAELTVEFGGGGINERNAKINDGSGQAEIRVYDGLVEDAATLNTLFSVGTCYDITGLVGEFSGTGQLYPRSLDDIVEVPCT